MVIEFGWNPNPDGVAEFVVQPNVGVLSSAAPWLLRGEHKDTFLWLPLMKLLPTWRRGAQGIGDCVSWGHELCVTFLMALMHAMGKATFITVAATEPIYGGGRCDINGSRGGWGDGSYGAAAVKWLTKWGVLLRLDYSSQTGNSEHNLTTYSSTKAKNWGNYGCGGSADSLGTGKLDEIARKMPVKRATLVRNVDELEAAIENGYPVSLCSGVGYGNMRRNSEGIVRRSDHWSHCMMVGGKKRTPNGNRLFRQFQSWGDSASGPDPGIEHAAISKCSWWCTEEDIQAQLNEGDSWALSDISGMPPQNLDIIRMSNIFSTTI